ncbi:MAG: serine/threonine protein kinase [Phycisphaerae bacterium]|nr:serine/threonine protein kinase [Phycisphaerae bacterium]
MRAKATEHDDDLRDARIGKILSDFAERRAAGEDESEAGLLAAHPDLADELRMHLEMLRNLGPGRARIDALIAQGILRRTSRPGYLAELGAYKIKGFIGQGGMGIVLKAYEESLNRTVALKILRPDLAGDQTALARFTREAQAVAALRHPNIVTVHAVGEEHGAHFLAMEFVDGPSLCGLIQEAGPLPAKTILPFFGQILSALARAHEAGLIHRDIKSSNILVDQANQAVKIADFGLARMQGSTSRMTTTGSILGTPEYMSPEQAVGTGQIDYRTDLYSAGVVLYEMLTGQTPFKADTPSAVIHQILHNDPPDPRTMIKDADPHLASLALRLMAKRPEDRFDSALEAIAALNAGERIRSPQRRRRVRRGMLIGLFATALLTGGFLWDRFSSRSDDRPRIQAVKVEQDSDRRNTLTISARYDDDSRWKPFHTFPVETRRVAGVVLVDPDGSGNRIVVAGTFRPLEGDCLFGYDVKGKRGNEVWRLDLSSERKWPDCVLPTRFGCWCLAVGDLDGEDGDELVVAASDHDQYASRVSIIDPRTREVRSTFWHMGQITQLLVSPDFLGPGRTAIIAGGLNNKLDGFHEPKPGDEEPLTRWDMVSVVMILDPEDMLDPVNTNSLGPPLCKHRVPDLQPVRPWAYAFLDLPQGPDTVDVSEGRGNPRLPEPDEVANVHLRRVELCPLGEDDTHCIRVPVYTPFRKVPESLAMIVNSSLEICRPPTDNVDYWHEHWCPIIQNGKYVNQPRSGGGS